ncbi:BZ3500_MvSof-1268-A1-R1_Chr2-1g04647 [Microbotryum saponariae]|uniref:Mannosyl-oligosaccharide glucosidase n=1 Tax=Microbotryum saponariae TaxID=289078 RepID=A0A2X0MAK1_9BASI|nr:BZ3500_MvSof-1268-A1-R1_Chr2-1g04647 [Microbotryum saponariae]SCZ92203.1 BZ3501_MvSof-1269-A2-R1_Chr2-1g04303 [Microbotryum saponariae]
MRWRVHVRKQPLLSLWRSDAEADHPPPSIHQSLLWGTYRPGLYFGVRPRIPASLMHGIMWFGLQDYASSQNARHRCSQDDGMVYTYTEHDARTAAKQFIKDYMNNVELTTEFLKVPAGDKGGNWAVRISGKPLDDLKPSRISLLNYFGNDASLGFLDLEKPDPEGIVGPITIRGETQELGSFKITVVDGESNEAVSEGKHAADFGDKLERTHFLGLNVPPGEVWKAKCKWLQSHGSGCSCGQPLIFFCACAATAEVIPVMMENAVRIFTPYGKRNDHPDPAYVFLLPDQVRSASNLITLQKTYEGTWSVDIFYDSDASPSKLDSAALSLGLSAASRSFIDRFEATFPLSKEFSASQRAFAQHITANLIGGVGYFYGSSIIDRQFKNEWDLDTDDDDVLSTIKKPELTPPRELLTATPSRSFFPRGFYWDEGFHLLPIGIWDNELSLEIVKSWVNLIDEDGWIGREQILGEEARAAVPEEFQAQYPYIANPPTLVIAIRASIERAHKAAAGEANVGADFVDQGSALDKAAIQSSAVARKFLASIYPKLRLHYEWFRSTQRGQIREYDREARSSTEAYRWRGRTKDHVLASGLDDYPRARPPHGGELQLDLLSWLGEFARMMEELAEFLDEEDDIDDYQTHHRDVLNNIEDLHWSEKDQMYCDASVDENDESYHVCHKGYLSLFPLLLAQIPVSSPKLGATLDLLRDPKHLWSPYGIRSLAKSHELYGKDENYWRGPIWIQMNYMVLSALHKTYAKQPGPYQTRAAQIYAELRKNVIDNVYNVSPASERHPIAVLSLTSVRSSHQPQEYVRTGAVWEQYDPETGKGQRSNPFTGWSSLVTLIMTEQY